MQYMGWNKTCDKLEAKPSFASCTRCRASSLSYFAPCATLRGCLVGLLDCLRPFWSDFLRQLVAAGFAFFISAQCFSNK
jgi:hypothetical protein